MRTLGRSILYRSTDVRGEYSFTVSRLDPDLHTDPTLLAVVMMDIHHHLAGRIFLLMPALHDFIEHAGSLALLIRKTAVAGGDS